ncbi:MAG: glycosyltransferase family 2 protein [Bilifractor sp.]|jgi:glycosyltransferase involved in cell wall biosynthesis
MEQKVSVIVPIYNEKKYLGKCVDSLRKQTLQEIEIILVDDGSTDGSGELADELARQDSRIRVVHRENGGLGPARSTGLDHARGRYAAFVDSDDWVRPRMYEKLYAKAEEKSADIVVSGHRDMVGGRAVRVHRHPLAGQTFSGREEIDAVRRRLYGHSPEETETEAFPMSVCMSLYRRSVIEERHLRFRPILSEDTVFNLSAYHCAGVISFTPWTDYCYRKEQQTSITHSFSGEKLKQYEEFLVFLAKEARAEHDPECVMRARRTAIDYCRLYTGIVGHSSDSFADKKRYVREFAENPRIRRCRKGYPVKTLPVQQRIFQSCIDHRLYGTALLLCGMRERLRI